MPSKTITQARLKELLHYDLLSGIFTWRVTRSNVVAGTVAGCPDQSGYIFIGIDGTLYRAHRLAFLYMLGWMPDQVDHDDQVKNNNRWINLNPSNDPGNRRNLPLLCTNTSGTCGVFWNKLNKNWRAVIQVNRKTISLGSFTKKSDAIEARQAADIKYGFHKNHGKQLAA